MDMHKAENAVTFTGKSNKEKMKVIADMIKKRIGGHKQEASATQDSNTTNIVEEIKKLAELKDQGVLNDEGFWNLFMMKP